MLRISTTNIILQGMEIVEQIKRIIIDSIVGLNLSLSNNMDKLNPIISLNNELFPNVNFNPTTGILQLAGNGIINGTFVISSNRATVDIQDPKDIKKICKTYLESVKKLANIFKIDVFKRIGVRAFICKKEENPISIDSLVMNKFADINISQLQKYGSNPEQIHFGFTTSYGKYKINHNFGKLVTQEINFNNGKIKLGVEQYLLYDIDFYRQADVRSDEIEQILDDAKDKIDSCSNEYFSKLEEK